MTYPPHTQPGSHRQTPDWARHYPQCNTPTTPCGNTNYWAKKTKPDNTLAQQLAYWRDTLTGIPQELALPTNRAPPGHCLPPGRHHPPDHPTQPPHPTDRTHRQTVVTVFMVLQAALAALLSRLGAGTDIPIGTVHRRTHRRSPRQPHRLLRQHPRPTHPPHRQPHLHPLARPSPRHHPGGTHTPKLYYPSNDWSKTFPRPAPWPATHCSRSCSPCRTTPRQSSTYPTSRHHSSTPDEHPPNSTWTSA